MKKGIFVLASMLLIFTWQTARSEKLPDNCGYNKGVKPITEDINMIILDDGEGGRRTFYYHTPRSEDELDCGKLPSPICFWQQKSMPVAPALRKAGVKGKSMTFIGECVVPE